MPQIKVQDLYDVVVTESSGIPDSWDIDFTVSNPPINANWWIVVESENTPKRDLMYYHNVVGSRIYVRSENRPSPKAHTSGVSVKMLDVAEIFNFFSDMVSQLFYVEKTGWLTVKVWWGYTTYNGNTVTVADTNITLANNTTNYIKYDYPTNTISSSVSSSGNVKVVVTTSWWSITDISYRNAKESFIDFTVSLTWALPPQTGNTGKVLTTDGTNVSWGSVVKPTGNGNDKILGTNASGVITEYNKGTASQVVLGDLSVANISSILWKYVQTIPLGEDIVWSTPTAISVIRWVGATAVPTLTSNTGNPEFIASMVLFSGTAFQCFDNNPGTSCSSGSTGSTWELRMAMTTAVALSYWMTCSWTNSSADLYMSHSWSGWVFSLQWSNDGTSWTTIQSFSGNDGEWNPVPAYVPAQSVAWLQYRLTWVVPSGAVWVYNWNFRFGWTTIQPIVYSNTMGGNIAGWRVKSGIRFSVPYATTLGTVKTSQVSTSANARVQLFQDDGTTLVAEQTPSSSDTVVFPNTPLTANTVYKLVLNDSTYFGGNNNELALATYQTWFRFAVSWTLNANDTVLPQNIKEVQLWTFKAMKSIANSTIEYATLAWFVVWPKSKWDLITLDANENTLVWWFSGLAPNFTYHIANTAWAIWLATWTTKSPVWYPVSSTELLITKRQSDTIKNLWNVAWFNHFGWSVYVNFLFWNFAAGQSVTFVGRSSITIYGSYVTSATAWGWYTATVELPPWEYKVIYSGTRSTSITIAH